MAKKSFKIPTDLASGLRDSVQSASTNQGKINYDIMLLNKILPDPKNPRKLTLTRDEVLNGITANEVTDKTKIKEFEALQELAESIKKIGIKNAIEVFKDGENYRIITGERRYWAAHLAGEKSVPVRISEKPNEFNLRYTQWVENINRQDLSLWEKFNNLLMISEAHQKNNQHDLTVSELQKLLGVSTPQAYRYLSLLKSEESVIDLIKEGKIVNLKIVNELFSMKDKVAKKQIISWIKASKHEITSLSDLKEGAGKKPSVNKAAKSSAGSVSLGKISNTNAAKHLLDIVLADPRLNKYQSSFRDVDWNSTKEISKAFKKLFKTLDKELGTESA